MKADRWDARSVCIFVIAVTVLLTGIGARGLNEPDEGRYAEASREMAFQDSWLLPHVGGMPHVTKPPLTYWLVATSIRILGPTEWAVRLPVALAAIGVVALSMHLAGLLFGSEVRWRCGLVLLSFPLFFGVERILTTDMILTFLVTASVVGWVDQDLSGRLPSKLIVCLALGLGFLTKGPVAWIVTLCAVLPWMYACRRMPADQVHRRAYLWIAIPVALMVASSWFLLLIRAYPVLWDYYIHDELIDRVASDAHHRAKPVWFYPAVLLGGMLPWLPLLPHAIRALMHKGVPALQPRHALLLGWVVLTLLFFQSVSSKMATYVVPVLPPLAIILARVWVGVALPRWWIRTLSGVATMALAYFLCSTAFHRPMDPAGPATMADYVMRPFFFLFIGWVGVLGACWFQRLRRFLDMAFVALLTATMVALSVYADQFINRSPATLKPLADASLTYQKAHGPREVVTMGLNAYGFDFYQQRLSYRLAAAHHPLPPDADHAHLAITSIHEFVTSRTNAVLLVTRINHLGDESLFTNWVRLARSGPVGLYAPPRLD